MVTAVRPILWLAVGALGGPGLEDVDFTRHVRPILERACFHCHGPEKRKSGLRLDSRATAFAGGLTGSTIVPGRSGESLLFRHVAGLDPEIRMPPEGEPLSAADVETIRAWIDQGASWPDDGSSLEHDPERWALRPVRRPPLPVVREPEWCREPLDYFILSRLEREGLSPSPEADRATLVRRLSLDLLGLPPSPREIEEILEDGAPDAHERLVERYLASPRHGERWARHWLDAVRFAETNGFETNTPRPNAWPYRDYVIRSLNEDKPYSLFVEEQIAGDVLGVEPATGFLVGGPYDEVKSPDIGLTLQQRMDELHDMISTTGSAFLGLTLGCARCHNHKFDPISQREYYHLQAVFAGVQHGERQVTPPGFAERAAEARELEEELRRVERKIWGFEPVAHLPRDGGARVRPAVSPLGNVDRFEPVEARSVRFTVLETNRLEPCIDELEVYTARGEPRNVALASAGAKARSSSDYAGSELHKLEHLNDGKYGNSRSWISAEPGGGWVEIELPEKVQVDRVIWARDREGTYQDRLALRYRIEVAAAPGAWQVVATSADRRPHDRGAKPDPAEISAALSGEAAAEARGLAARRAELAGAIRRLSEKPSIYAGRFEQPKPTHILHRGDALQPREPVPPGGIRALGMPSELPDELPEALRRQSLAHWIADPSNPLTARVLVNRLWLHHFGEGLVATPGDFGANGARPSHPELLDWLAAELVACGWSVKAIHRRIVLSSTYRQSSRPSSGAILRDAASRLLWRFPPRRLEAEAIRDSILSVSGNLDLSMGGPGYDVFEPNTNYVRVYNARVKLGPPEWRRMVYQYKVRMEQDSTFGIFDCPDAGQVCPKRTRSTTPLQSLNLLNSPFILDQSRAFAERLQRERGGDIPGQVRLAFLLAFGREPDREEASRSLEFVERHCLETFARVLFNSNELLFLS
ncbi:MAG TPA: PSD1 and planctomycete cytochrome C domain-containing protein [Planctomycetota bacterium]|nr:PSD1 and planctomycete cytochrome C domain-containing protein [Planctomycetota bacterium]